MVKVWISADERYPFYSLETDPEYASGPTTELSEEFCARYQAAEAEFEVLQNELAKLYDAANKPPAPKEEPPMEVKGPAPEWDARR